VSSVYDFVTFFVLLRVLHASEREFHTGWFMESLLTQTLVIFIIRTGGSPLTSKPSRALTWSALGVAGLALAIPLSPFARGLGFVPLPGAYYLFLVAATVTYLGLVEVVKRLVLRRALA
jgi:Mg2+-importing ATPase